MTVIQITRDFLKRFATSEPFAEALRLLEAHLGNDMTPDRLRDVVARQLPAERPDLPPEMAIQIISALMELFNRASQDCARGCLPVLEELRHTLPRALEIAQLLSGHLAARRGPFHFPEFLASFEGGGRSLYDMDEGRDAGAREGYFKISRIEGVLVEAEELISEETFWPVIFPEKVAALLEPGYIINLELIRTAEGWSISGSGLAYPPNTDVP
jgi:hypothetical protein